MRGGVGESGGDAAKQSCRKGRNVRPPRARSKRRGSSIIRPFPSPPETRNLRPFLRRPPSAMPALPAAVRLRALTTALLLACAALLPACGDTAGPELEADTLFGFL